MGYSNSVIILPGHDLDSLPFEMSDDEAEGLINAFAVACHPVVLAETGQLPQWKSADDGFDDEDATLFFIPPVSEQYLHHSRLEDPDLAGVVRGISTRDQMLEAARSLCREHGAAEFDAELAADCMSVGIAHAFMEVLTRRMHYFTNTDEVVLQENTVAAAQAILEDQPDDARKCLTAAFECLQEARERFYPVDCFLIDLCLLNAQQANAHLPEALAAGMPINLLIQAQELSSLAPEVIDQIRSALRPAATENGPLVSLVGGEFSDVAAPLVPLSLWLRDFSRGRDEFRKHLGLAPATWGRRRFGFSPLCPQVLRSFGYHTALHFGLDDGDYPDTEHSKLVWEGCDGTEIDAMTRIPVAIDSAAGFMKLPERIAESMQEDMVAAVVFARWPKLRSSWLSDFQRMHKYARVFVRFVTLDEFAEESGDAGHSAAYAAREYMSPFLIQASVRGDAHPITQYVRLHRSENRYFAARVCQVVADLIGRRPPAGGPILSGETDDGIADAERAAISALATRAGTSLTEENDGTFVFNPLSFPRTLAVDAPDGERTSIVDVPALGFVWTDAKSQPAETRIPLAQPELMHNGKFEVHINPRTGGIASIKEFGRRPNRVSQQLAFRYPVARSLPVEEGAEPRSVWYSTTVCHDVRVLRSDVCIGEVESVGELQCPVSGERLCTFSQQTRVVRDRPLVEIRMTLDDLDVLPEGNPWLSYYTCRFAWDDPSAALTRSQFGQAHGLVGERVESPHYLEIASDERQTTIVCHGLPFHRRTRPRMMDSILVVEGETTRSFRMTVALDQKYPQQAALDAMVDPLAIPSGRPSVGERGWFLNISARNVLLQDCEYSDDTGGLRLRMLETEGRAVLGTLRCFRPVRTACRVDLQGEPVEELDVDESGSVSVSFRKYELCDLLLQF